MIRRRHDHKPLADRNCPHWLTVSDMYGHLLESELIASGTDLYDIIARTMDRWSAEGWTIEDDGRYGSFFCTRDGIRRFVHIRPTDPEAPLIGPSWYEQCPTCGE